MTGDFDFKAEADKMLLAARFLADLDLDSITETAERAHSLGPIVDPTAYRDALQSGDLEAVAALAAALKPAAKIFRERIAPKLPS